MCRYSGTFLIVQCSFVVRGVIMATMSPKSYTLKNTDVVFLDDTVLSSREYVLKIKDMPTEDKPREKLLKYGSASLSIHELLAVVWGTGTKKEGVLEMASRVLKEYGERSLSSQHNPLEMVKDLKIPLIKAIQIIACGELGRRFFSKKEETTPSIRSAQDAYHYLHDMHHLPKEHFRGIYLNTHHRIVHDEVISIGTLNANIIHPREVFRPAIEHGAAALILAHNHPSGITKPSEADIDVTKQLVAAGKMIGINVLDHIIITKETFVSIKVDYN